MTSQTVSQKLLKVVQSDILKGWYHKLVSNVRYAVISLTTVRPEWCFALSERFETSALVRIGHITNMAGGGRCYNVSKFCDIMLENIILKFENNCQIPDVTNR